PVDQHQRGQVGDRLGRGPYVDDGVLGPRGAVLGVAPAAPDVHDGVPVDVDGDAGAEVVARLQLPGEGGPDGLEAGITSARDLGHRRNPSQCATPVRYGT